MKDYQSLLMKLKGRRLSLSAKGKGVQAGTRRSFHYGSSLDFSDYKQYAPGDDLRQIDWNVYGRTNKPYVKRFLDEKELFISILLDSTASMQQIDSKWELAKELAASLAYITLSHEDRLYFHAPSTNSSFFYRKGSIYNKQTFYEILSMTGENSSECFAKSLEKVSIEKSELIIIITDGLEPVASFKKILSRWKIKRKQIWFIQLVSGEEINPTIAGDSQLVDSETGEMVDVSLTSQIKQQYKNRVKAHNKELSLLCANYHIHYMLLRDDSDIQKILLMELVSKGFVH